MCSFIVSTHLGQRVAAMPDVPERSVKLDQLNGSIGKRDELGLGGRHGDAGLPT